MVPDGYTLGWKSGGTNLPIIFGDKILYENRKYVGAEGGGKKKKKKKTLLAKDGRFQRCNLHFGGLDG